MTIENAKKVYELFDHGLLVHVTNGPYLDSLVHGIWFDENKQEYFYDSQVYTNVPLSKIDLDDVDIYYLVDPNITIEQADKLDDFYDDLQNEDQS